MVLLYKISFLLILLILAGFIFLATFGRKLIGKAILTKAIAGRHEQKTSMFRAAPIVKGAILFVGDSITEGGNWSELFPEKHVLNRGIGGDISEGVLKRLDEIIRHQPSKMFICIGTNDLAAGIKQPEIIENYRSILNEVKTQSPDTKIYVQSVLPVGKRVFFGHNNEKIIPLNREIKKLCTEMKITYIDLFPSFIDHTGYLNPAYTNDNLHLLGNGYLFWVSLIQHFVDE